MENTSRCIFSELAFKETLSPLTQGEFQHSVPRARRTKTFMDTSFKVATHASAHYDNKRLRLLQHNDNKCFRLKGNRPVYRTRTCCEKKYKPAPVYFAASCTTCRITRIGVIWLLCILCSHSWWTCILKTLRSKNDNVCCYSPAKFRERVEASLRSSTLCKAHVQNYCKPSTKTSRPLKVPFFSKLRVSQINISSDTLSVDKKPNDIYHSGLAVKYAASMTTTDELV